jgi:hypothetical protein
MSAEFIAAMSDSSGYYSLEHDVTRHVFGDAESVRVRLADALEQMGYRILNDSPIQARRNAKSSAASGCAQDILQYQTSLNIGVKSAGTNLTRVTFDYEMKGVYLAKGDRQTLTREAEAILALAMARTSAAHCPACGADTAGSSRFCRQCGSPLIIATPPEIEVLQLTSNANASSKNIGAGLFFLILATLILPLLFLHTDDPVRYAKILKVVLIISGSLGITGLLMILFGYWRLQKIINKPIEHDSLPQPSRRGFSESNREINAPDTNELPPASIQHPITEATTDLLPHEVKRAI